MKRILFLTATFFIATECSQKKDIPMPSIKSDYELAKQLSEQINGKKNNEAKVRQEQKPAGNVHHVEAIQQKGASCGYHSIINAWAIQQLIVAKKPLDSKAIAEKAAQKGHLIPENVGNISQSLSLDEIITWVNNDILDVANLYCLAKDGDNIILAGIHENNHDDYETFIRKLRTQQQAYGFFLCHYPHHWFLIAVVKNNNQMPQIYVLDSLGGSLNATRLAFVDYLQTQIA